MLLVAWLGVICWKVAASSELRTNTSDNLRIQFDPQDYTTTFSQPVFLNLWIDGSWSKNLSVLFNAADNTFVLVRPHTTRIYEKQNYRRNLSRLEANGLRPGRFVVTAKVEPKGEVDDRRLFVHLKIALNQPMIYISLLIGWSYTACWSTGYYPQILLNYRKRSVVGLSFDFLHINIVGHISYAIFNSFLYWNSYIEQEYFNRHPYGLNPVIGNDVGFAIHASFATGYTIVQCYVYESGGNSVSTTAKGIIWSYVVIMLVSFIMVLLGTYHWLDFLYVLSYIKLSTTLVKYFPQAYINYKRKSTEGFSIVNRLLDIAGGLFGILQMVINAWNFDDWQSITGDPVKFGMGLFSILFDLVFIVQHYFLYRKQHVTGNNDMKVMYNLTDTQ
ncbi:cystinosin homolog [Sabethes cyaneus]|uniref:cystinosin homolog n=1 Tax=Sabethes cyaneus TaxID=53552 RepID=UPI00237D53AC|nr:cystinosin homolog [Sabethes cyaneus]